MSEYGYTRIRVGEDWVEPSDILHYDSSSWVSVSEGFVRYQNGWRKIWPPRAPQRSDVYNSQETALWHDYSDGWHGGSWGTQPEQGAHPIGNHRGCWFYGNRPWAVDLAEDGGRHITRIEMYLHRIEGHMGWGSAGHISPRIWWHEHGTRPNSRPSFFGGPHMASPLERDEAKWVDLPLAWSSVILSGRAKGFGVFTPNGGPNAAFQLRGAALSAGRIRITHA